MIIYRPSDRITLKLGEVTLKVSPLSALQKANLMSLTKMSGGKEVADTSLMAIMTVKYTLKEVSVLDATFPDGSPFSLTFDPDGTLTDDALTCVMQILDNQVLVEIAAHLLTSNIEKMSIPGVEIVTSGGVDAKKK